MAHSLIIGMTESGKTTLAKRLAKRYGSHGQKVIVLDSLNDPEWAADFQTTDPDEFLSVFWASRRCAVFIDEAGDAVGKFNTVMQRTATRGRHWGHAVHFITQRSVQLSPTVRDQCGHIFLLTTSLKDSKVHADEWNQPQLATAHTLRKGEYFHCTRFGVLERGSLFGVSTHGPDSDIRDGGRDVREAKEGTNPSPQPLGAGDPGESGPGGGAGRRPRHSGSAGPGTPSPAEPASPAE